MKTPCIGRCSTTYGDIVCRGCYRRYDEVIAWNKMEMNERIAIMSRINNILSQLIHMVVDVPQCDEDLMCVALTEDQLQLSKEAQVYEILCSYPSSSKALGIVLKAPYASLAGKDLKRLIQQQIHSKATEMVPQA